MHEIVAVYENEEVTGGHFFRVLPPLVDVIPPDMAPCALGSLVQVLVNATGAPKREDILVTAYSPLGRALQCPLTTIDGTNSATFKPDEPGIWRIEITYQGKQIQGGPFTCSVFDPNGVQVSGLEGAVPMVPHAVDIDCRDVGVPGEVFADIVHDKRSVHSRIEKVDNEGFLYRVHFTPMDAGKHRVYIYFNGYDVRGSPFMMRVGTQRRSKSNASPSTAYRKSPSPLNTGRNSTSPINQSYSSTSKNTNSFLNYRQTASPVYASDTHRYAQDYHRLTVNENKRMSSVSPNFIERSLSPSLAPRANSPTFAQRPYSPNYMRAQSPDYVTSKKFNERKYESNEKRFETNGKKYETEKRFDLNDSSKRNDLKDKRYDLSEKRYETSSPSLNQRTNYESSYTNKMNSMRISDSRSPVFGDSPSPEVGYTSNSKFEKRFTESRTYHGNYDETDRIDSTPLIKVSPANDRIATGRRDSWDALEKTKNVLSKRSLESLANLNDAQLDDRNQNSTYINKEQHFKSQNYSQNYTQKYDSSFEDGFGDKNYGFRSGGGGGAQAVKVQSIPDGVLGQPVEFESKFFFFNLKLLLCNLVS